MAIRSPGLAGVWAAPRYNGLGRRSEDSGEESGTNPRLRGAEAESEEWDRPDLNQKPHTRPRRVGHPLTTGAESLADTAPIRAWATFRFQEACDHCRELRVLSTRPVHRHARGSMCEIRVCKFRMLRFHRR